MKHINKRTDPVSRRALKKSVKVAERQQGKKELLAAIEQCDDVIDPVFWGEGCSCGCCGWYDDLEYMPVAENTIGGRFLNTLKKLGLVENWKKDSTTSELYYSVARAPQGLIASIYVRPDSLK
jgi:hypothetical protein